MDPTIIPAISSLFTSLKELLLAAVALMHVFQVMKNHETLGVLGKLNIKGWHLSGAISTIATVCYAGKAWFTGRSFWIGALEGLFTIGLAMFIYDAWKQRPQV